MGMTLDEAIKYAENMAILSHRGSGNDECEQNHKQLAEWLKDYKRLKEQEPCEDCISRQTACDAIRKYKSVVSVPDEYDIAFDDGIDTAIAVIGHNVPSVIQKPKTGHWILHEIEDTLRWYECDQCGASAVKEYNYCHDCGIKMQEVEE